MESTCQLDCELWVRNKYLLEQVSQKQMELQNAQAQKSQLEQDHTQQQDRIQSLLDDIAHLTSELDQIKDEHLELAQEWAMETKSQLDAHSEQLRLLTSERDHLKQKCAEQTEKCRETVQHLDLCENRVREMQQALIVLQNELRDTTSSLQSSQQAHEQAKSASIELEEQVAKLQSRIKELEIEIESVHEAQEMVLIAPPDINPSHEEDIAAYQAFDAQIVALNEELADLKSQLEEKLIQLAEKESENDDLKAQLDQSHDQIAQKESELVRLRAELAETVDAKDDLEQKYGSLAVVVNSLKEQLVDLNDQPALTKQSSDSLASQLRQIEAQGPSVPKDYLDAAQAEVGKLGQELENAKTQLTQLQSQCNDTKIEIQSQTATIQRLYAEIASLKTKQEESDVAHRKELENQLVESELRHTHELQIALSTAQDAHNATLQACLDQAKADFQAKLRDKLQEVEDGHKVELGAAVEKCVQLQSKLSSLQEGFEDERDATGEQLVAAVERISALEDELKAAEGCTQNEIDAKTDALNEVARLQQELQDQAQASQTDLSHRDTSIQTLQAERQAAVGAKLALEAELKVLIEEKKSIDETRKKAETDKIVLENALALAKQKAENDAKILQDKVKKAEEDAKKAQNDVKTKENELAETQSDLVTLQALFAALQVRSSSDAQELLVQKKSAAELKVSVDAAKSEQETLTALSVKLKADVETLTQANGSLTSTNANLTAVNTTLTVANAKLRDEQKNVNSRVVSLTGELDAQQAVAEQLRKDFEAEKVRVADLKEVEKQVEAFKASAADLKTQLIVEKATSADLNKKLTNATARADAETAKVQGLEDKCQMLEASVAQKDKALADALADRAKLDAAHKQVSAQLTTVQVNNQVAAAKAVSLQAELDLVKGQLAQKNDLAAGIAAEKNDIVDALEDQITELENKLAATKLEAADKVTQVQNEKAKVERLLVQERKTSTDLRNQLKKLEWTCPRCTLINRASATTCDGCNLHRA